MFDWLFSTDGFVPRAHCGTGWSWPVIYTYNTGSGLTVLSYILIPFVLTWCYVLLKRINHGTDAGPRWMYLSFALFILFCGLGHLWDILVFYYPPPYRAIAVWSLLTGIVSAGGVVASVRTVRFLTSRLKSLTDDNERLVRVVEGDQNVMRQTAAVLQEITPTVPDFVLKPIDVTKHWQERATEARIALNRQLGQYDPRLTKAPGD